MKLNTVTIAMAATGVLFAVVACAVQDRPVRNRSEREGHAARANQRDASRQSRPTVIWFHSGVANSIESLKVALSSGLITHVLLLDMHRADADWKKSPDVLRAIAIVKQSQAKLIWSRDLWPYRNNAGITPAVLFDSKYYIQEIRALRAEAEAMGAPLVGLDLEPYGTSPLRQCLVKNNPALTAEQVKRLHSAVQEAISQVGRVDYVLPAGQGGRKHPYEELALLGTARIAEATYYANDQRIKRVRHPYEVFGAFVSPHRYRAVNPKSPYFLVQDIFERTDLWSSRNQLFLYSRPEECLDVARDLVAYARTQAARGDAQSGKAETP